MQRQGSTMLLLLLLPALLALLLGAGECQRSGQTQQPAGGAGTQVTRNGDSAPSGARLELS